jgi:hypothetical protein
MHFPAEWSKLGMIPTNDYLSEVIRLYKPGNEDASEHDRNGFFHFWLKRNPTKEQLLKLIELSFLDPDQMMASDVRNYISKAAECDAEIKQILRKGGAV